MDYGLIAGIISALLGSAVLVELVRRKLPTLKERGDVQQQTRTQLWQNLEDLYESRERLREKLVQQDTKCREEKDTLTVEYKTRLIAARARCFALQDAFHTLYGLHAALSSETDVIMRQITLVDTEECKSIVEVSSLGTHFDRMVTVDALKERLKTDGDV